MSVKRCAEELKNEEVYLRKEMDSNYCIRESLIKILTEIRKCLYITSNSTDQGIVEAGDIVFDFENKVILALAKTVEVEGRLDKELEENLDCQHNV